MQVALYLIGKFDRITIQRARSNRFWRAVSAAGHESMQHVSLHEAHTQNFKRQDAVENWVQAST
jgi:hypothetical protein